MKSKYADLVSQVVSSYDQTKTTIQGRVFSKTINSNTVLGPPVNKFVDVFTDAAVAPNNIFMTPNNRIFTFTTVATGLATLTLYTVDLATLTQTYVGKVVVKMPNLAATTHTYRSIKVVDTGTSGWKVFLSTLGSVVINGGTFLINNLALADFVPVGFPTIPFATGNDQKAVYFLQDPLKLGANHSTANVANVASAGSILDSANNLLYVHDGVAATHRYFIYNTNTTPTWSAHAITGTEATNTINDAGHTYVNGDQVTFTSLTGGAGLLTTVDAYFVVGAVAGVSYQLSLTSGGAAINFTTDISAGTIGRAFGITGDLFSHQTGNLPALTGTLLLIDSEDYAMPGHTTNSGFACAFFATSSNLYLGQLSELTAGAVTWPSLITVNLLGTANQIAAPSTVLATWSNVLDKVIYTTATNIFVMKSFVNNSIDYIFGGVNNRYLETLVANDVVELGAITLTGMDVESGVLAVVGSTVGQRGIYLVDLRSEAGFDYSYIVTKVIDTPQSVYKFITTIDELYDYTGSLEVYYRTSGFGSISGGWTLLPFAEDLSGFASGAQVQFKILFTQLGLDTCIPAQLNEFVLGYDSLTEVSDNWEFNFDDSDVGSPSRVSFRLKTAYASSVPTLYFRAYDLSNTLVANHNTSANAALFEYSTDSGTNWLALGTIPNTVGTLIRYNFSSPPGVEVRPSIKES